MVDTISLNTQYVTVWCGKTGCDQQFAMTRSYYDETMRTRNTWYCPRGHPRVWAGDTTEAKLAKAEARELALKDQLAAATHEAEEIRKTLLRDRQRFANGVCPCCNRAFENVQQHMKNQHPDYDITKVVTRAEPEFRCSCGRVFSSLRGLGIHQGHSRRPGWDRPNALRWSAHLTKI